MSDLSQRTQALLDASRGARNPSPRQLEQVRHALLAKVAVGAAVAGYGATAGAAAGVSSGIGLGAKLVVVSALALGSVGGAHWLSSRDDVAPVTPASAPSAPVRAALPNHPAPTPTPAVSVDELPQQPPQSSTPSRVSPGAAAGSAQRATPSDALLEEARLLREIQQALGAGQATRALEGLRQYDAKFPRGSLRIEAEAARALALCQGGASDAGRAAAERFLKRYPGSPAVTRVRQACSEPVR